jgi:hypothetical protein
MQVLNNFESLNGQVRFLLRNEFPHTLISFNELDFRDVVGLEFGPDLC